MSSELPLKKILLHFLRVLALGLLTAGYALYLRELISPVFWAVSFIAGTAFAFFATSRLRFLPGAGLFVLTAAVLRFVLFFLFRVAGDSADFLSFIFDLNFVSFIPPLVLSWLFSYWALRKEAFIRWEVVLNGWLVLLLFFSQGRYDISILPHPFYLALGTSAFVLIEFLILIIQGSKTGNRRIHSVLFILVLILVLAGGFVLFLGRYSKGAVSQGGGLVKPTLFRFDFSKYIKLESEITMNSDLVLLYREEEPYQQNLLRRFVLSGYDSQRGFYMETAPGESDPLLLLPEERINLPDPGWEGRMDALQEYYLVNFDPSSLVAMNYPVEVVPFESWDSSSFLRAYKVVSRIPGFLTWELVDSEYSDPSPGGKLARDLSPDAFEFYTDYGNDQRIRELAEEVTPGLSNRYDMINAIILYLQEEFYYSLKPGVAEDGNQLHHFLFESRKGYCSYFAFSMALMCRSLGIPARVAVGFFMEPELGVMNIYPVRSDMAHAWVEVFFPGYGWINFDPTSTRMAPGEDIRFGSLDVDKFLSLVEEILSRRDSLTEAREPEAASAESAGGSWDPQRVLGIIKDFWYLFLIAVLLAGAVLGELRDRVKLFYFLKVRKNYRQAMEASFSLIDRRFRIRGKGRTMGESPMEWYERTSSGRKEVEHFVNLLLKARYGPNFTGEDYLSASSLVRPAGRVPGKMEPVWFFRLILPPLRRRR